MIHFTDKDGDNILYLDEHREKAVKKIISRQKAQFVLTIIILALLLLSSGLFVFTKYIDRQVGLVALVNSPYTEEDIPGFDPTVTPIPPDDRIDQLNQKLELNQMCINMVSSVTFKNAYSSGKFNIVNDSANNFPHYVTITLNSNNSIIYQTGLIKPGMCIIYDTLDVVLPKGTYECTATFTQVDPDNKRVCGRAAAKVLVTVQN